uniref:putative bifunctional UDP-N-acetylglucosamine transferase and deubiquitinase ALG13 isoform X2 n=1 Tax=Doryrhamphus excisus TaxID=161450 RepID=UPI0025AE1228|nr:putative bifunctional UDP-N-acetylglucosamine transferase and deubiquitinase ALG13 isoform X2 [Doryrhamphus excisus]
MHKGLKKYFVNMDDYLDSLGLYRKRVARDSSSLFRAVSEQLYYSQNYHHMIRQDCANFMRANVSVFESFVEGSFEKYLERLENPKETGGQVEIKALSQLYRRRFLIYRYPGKPPSAISEGDFVDKLMLCCSINGHYDIVYAGTYPASAALCQAVLYELLYTKVFGCEEAELCQAMEVSKVGGRCYGNTPPMEEVESGAAAKETQGAESGKPPCILSLPYKVIKSLNGDVYRNVEFDVWQDMCNEMQKKKTNYLVFAGRRYFLGDKCQVRLEPKGKYFNAFIQEIGTHSNAVTVFIEKLGERHLVPLTDLNPVPAWNVATASRKGRLDSDVGGRRHRRHSHFRRSRGSSGMKGAAPLCFQPAGHPRPPPPPAGAIPYDPYGPPYHHPPPYGVSSSRYLNLPPIGPQLVYYAPSGRRYYDDESYAFRPRRRWRRCHRRQQMAVALNKECQFAFPDTTEESADLDGAITYSQLDDANEAAFPPQTAPSVAQSPAIGAPPPPVGSAAGHTIACSSEEEQVDASTVEDQGELVYYAPTERRYYDDESYAFRPRRRCRRCHQRQQMAAALNKEYQFVFPDTAEESADLDGAITYSQLDDANEAAFPPQTAPSVAQSPAIGAPPPPVGSAAGHTIACSSEEEQVDASTVEDQVSAPTEPAISQDQQEEGVANSPPRADVSHSYTQQVVKPLGVISTPSSSPPSSPSSPSSRAPAAPHLSVAPHTPPRSVAIAFPAASPWLVNELGETLCTVVTPPPYSYDPNGNDLPRDYRVLQYYFNLGLQWYHRSCWQQQQVYTPSSPDTPYPYQHCPTYLSQEAPLHAAPHSYPEVGRRPYQLSPSYPDSNRAVYRQPGTHGGGPTPSMEGYSVNGLPSRPVSSSALLYQDQTALLHLPYEAPPPATYLSSAPPLLPHTAHNTHYTPYHPSTPLYPLEGRCRQAAMAHGSTAPPVTLHMLSSQRHPLHHPSPHYIPPAVYTVLG